MAKGSTMDQTICKRLCHLSIEQEPDTPPMHTSIQNPSPGECAPVYANCNGPNYRTTHTLRLRCNLNHHGSRVQLGHYISPLPHHYHQTPDRAIVLPTCIPLVQVTPLAHIQQRSEVHIPL